MKNERIAILDCGGQYTKVIDRKVREAFAKSDIFPVSICAEEISGCNGIIITGGPESVWDENALLPDPGIYELGIPILGICYGMHVIAQQFGGVVAQNIKMEYGEAQIDTDTSCPLFMGLSESETVLMSHGDTIKTLPDGFITIAKSADAVAGMYEPDKKIYGVQFHPEVDMTVNGRLIFENFLRGVCGLKEYYSLEDRLESAIAQVRGQAGENKVMCLVSGGVDSAVTAGILLRALPIENIYAVHIDHGFMRKNESDLICESLKTLGLKNLKRINAKDIFFGKLKNVTEPEKKREIIGDTFIQVLKKEIEDLNLNPDTTFIAQGTLRPDLIESGNPDVSAHAKKIKTHHNDVDIVRKARDKGLIIETNYDWHKDEVRKIAAMLGLPEEIAQRQPFPGPGLAIRLLLCDGTKTIDGQEDAALKKLASDSDYGYNVCMLPIQSVGVQGDNRTYAGLAAVWSAAEPKWGELHAFAREVTNKLTFINRLVFCLAGGEKAEKAKAHSMYIDEETTGLLRELDYVVTKRLKDKVINQTFAVLLPLSEGGVPHKYSVVIRTFITGDFMTGRPAPFGDEYDISYDELTALAGEIKHDFPMVDYVFYDITGKPPATCEWE